MNIGFEAKRLFTNNTGLGNYSRFIVDALSQHFLNNNYYLYTPKHILHPEAEPILDRQNVNIITASSFYKISRCTSIWRTWGISKESITQQLDVFHGLSQELPINLPGKIKKLVTVHDLIFYRYPKFYNPIDVAIYKSKLQYACKKADKIVAISKQTSDDLIDFLSVDKSKIEIIYQGCHPSFNRTVSEEEKQRVTSKYGLPDKYLLNVGTIQERKNVLSLLKAFRRVPEHRRIPLVVVGQPTPYLKLLKEFISVNKLEPWIIFLHHALFSDFPALYQGACVFIYPSLFEGFGIPLIEAIKSGVPVIASKGSCFAEAGGPHSKYVVTSDEEEFALQIMKVTEDNNDRDKMIKESSLYIQKFQPEIIASELFKLYQSF